MRLGSRRLRHLCALRPGMPAVSQPGLVPLPLPNEKLLPTRARVQRSFVNASGPLRSMTLQTIDMPHRILLSFVHRTRTVPTLRSDYLHMLRTL